MHLLAVCLFASAGAMAIASPVASPQGEDVANVGQCPLDCWNESAARAGCDPNADDDCLCGPFIDAVTTCISQACSIEDNLAALDFLEPACEDD